MIAAQNLIKLECSEAELKLVDKDVDFNSFIEWKLYQLHKPVHAKSMKGQISSGMYSQLIDNKKADFHLVATEPTLYTSQPPATTPKLGSSIKFDPVRAAAQDAARDVK